MGDFVVGGYQADIDSGATYTGINYEERGRGILATRGERVTIAPDGKKTPGESIGKTEELQKLVKAGDWNEYRIVAQEKAFALRQWTIDVRSRRCRNCQESC